MTPLRTADEKFLALLGRMPAPMDSDEICRALSWSRQRVREVAGRLAREGRIVRVEGERDGSVGRPSDSFALPGALPAAGARPVPLDPETVVVTPKDWEARVIGMRGRSFAEVEYITGPERYQRAVLHIRLLRAFQPGRPRPEPVRVATEATA